MKKLYLIGAGPGAEELLSGRALNLIKSCRRIYSTSERLAQMLSGIRSGISECPLSQIGQVVAGCDAEDIALLVSGDTGFFSAASSLSKELESSCEIEFICGLSSLQYFCSKLGTGYEDIKTVSLHGREKNISGAVSYNPRVFVLTGGSNKAHEICKRLVNSGLGNVRATAGENLSMPSERIIKGSIQDLSEYIFEDLTVLLLENDLFARANLPLSDSDFERGEVPMTKEEVRAVTLAKLAVEPENTVYDIGAGTGSVAIELARKACEGEVYAIEQKSDAAGLINKNRRKLGAYNVTVVSGRAPEVFKELPRPDRAFIGGSSGSMGEIVRQLVTKNPQIRLTANAVTLEGLDEAVKAFEGYGFETDIVCINSSVAKKVGNYHMMNANNPVYIITGKI